MSDFAATTSTEGQRLVVSLAGECDLTVRSELASVLADAINRSPTVVVDLGELAFLDSSGIHELISAHHLAREQRGHVYVRNASGIVASVLDLTGIDRLLHLPEGDNGSTEDSGR